MSDPGTPRQTPNIILILVDDMGFSDIGCYGSEIRTPNLDQLADGGVRFTQMYNCARCCPTRASLLTGLYPHQAGVGHMVNDLGHPAYQGYLNDRCVTIAEALGGAGYRTLMSGKWHVGGAYPPLDGEWAYAGEAGFPLPIQRGFDRHYGTLGGGGSYFNPPSLVLDGASIRAEGNRAVRQGAWKLVSRHPGDWELYNMEKDRTELDDFSEKNRDKAEELKQLYNEWAERIEVQPWEEIRK